MSTNEIPMRAPGEPDRPDHDLTSAASMALARISASDGFRGAPQLVAFLRFIVERALEGRAAEIKGYTIATEALGRGPDFDPQSDPIVRVEAGRLRRALAQYYSGEGAADPLRIVVPLGGYVPRFERYERMQEPPPAEPGPMVEAPPADPPSTPREDRAASRRWLALSAGALALAAVAVGLWHLLGRNALDAPLPAAGSRPAETGRVATGAESAATAADLPVVSIVVGDSIGDLPLQELTGAFSRNLIDALTRFDDLVTVKALPPSAPAAADVDYVFEMNAARVGDDIAGLGRLRSVRDGRIVWTTSIQRTLAQGAADPEIGDVARRLAAQLAEPSGIIHADFRQAPVSPAMLCLYRTHDYRRVMTAEAHLAARSCLAEVIAAEPRFHPAWSQMALMILDEHLAGYNVERGQPLERALAAALTAVRLGPSSARARQALMRVHFARGAVDDALRAGREALALNPFDPEVMAVLGARYVQLNRPAEGLPLIVRGIELSQGRPAWYDFFAFLGARLLGAEQLAENHAAVLALDGTPFGLLGVALNSARAGDADALAAALGRLAGIAPAFAADPAAYLARTGFSPAVTDRILADLGAGPLASMRPN